VNGRMIVAIVGIGAIGFLGYYLLKNSSASSVSKTSTSSGSLSNGMSTGFSTLMGINSLSGGALTDIGSSLLGGLGDSLSGLFSTSVLDAGVDVGAESGLAELAFLV
jgi:hypothetical protein